VVVWTFFTGNDYTDDLPSDSYQLDELLDQPYWELAEGRSGDIGLVRRFRAIGYLRFVLTYLRDVGPGGISQTDFEGFPQETFMRIQKQRLAFLLDHMRVRQAFRYSVKPRLIKAIELCQHHGILFLLVVAPDRAEIEFTTAAILLDALQTDGTISASEARELRSSLQQGDPLPTSIGTQLLHQFDALEGVWILDLTEPFREQTGGLYFERDSHWNCRGNDVAGRFIARKIKSILQHNKHTDQ
jgi:hypothetical protein